MPVSIGISHDTYLPLLAQERLHPYLCESTCPHWPDECPAADRPTLNLTDSTVDRPFKVLNRDAEGTFFVEVLADAEVALACCPACKGRFRVLPCDVLPRKRFALDIIEHLLEQYGDGERGLRPVAWELGEAAPSHTTLHAWTEGLGAYLRGRATGEVEDALPASRAVGQAEYHHPELEEVRCPVAEDVEAVRCRSEARRHRLAACLRFLTLTTWLLDRYASQGELPRSLAFFNRLVLSWCASWPFGFRTGLHCTSSEHIGSADRVYSSSQAEEWEEGTPWQTHSRSPPGDTSRSHPSSTQA